MTTTGKQCLFPFYYSNSTDLNLVYKICSSQDNDRPWCPTGKKEKPGRERERERGKETRKKETNKQTNNMKNEK
jgi:hypothetical protein